MKVAIKIQPAHSEEPKDTLESWMKRYAPFALVGSRRLRELMSQLAVPPVSGRRAC